mgnify:CR=1 FL=1
MANQIPIDKLRDRGGYVDIGTKEDGAIVEMFDIDGVLIIIKEKALYELRYADDIDPGRVNPNLPPNVQRLLLKLGSESELLSRTFITAKKLFRKESLVESFNINSALRFSLEAATELATMESEINNYLADEKKVCEEYETNRSKEVFYTIPSITDVTTRCKTIFQKADHVMQALMDIIKLFYNDLGKSPYYSDFINFIEKKYGNSDPFYEYLKKIFFIIEMIRNIRNCLDHRRSEILIKDFEIQLDGNVLTPTIEIEYLNSKLDRISLESFLPIILQNLITIFENMLVGLCNKNLAQTPFTVKVVFVPPEKRKNKFVQYGYWSALGPGGFFQQ